jgi:hypothetical protein
MFHRATRLSAGLPRPAIASLMSLVFTCAVVVPSLAQAPPRLAPASPEFTSAEECARCHTDIAKNWKTSMHAQAADNPRYQAAFARARTATRGDLPCMRCHAPAAVYMRDTKWQKKTSWEGVTCDFCHSVRSVRGGSTDQPFVVEVGRVKTGPLKDSRPTAHDASFSDVYTSSSICAPCHQWTNDRKLDVLSTYTEWQASAYRASETTCQSCHMRETTGSVVDPKVARSGKLGVNVHEMPGGHSQGELNRALQAVIGAVRKGDDLEVTVQVTNRGAGHMVPTGSPLRRILMVVEADNGVTSRQSARRVYGRQVVDEAGRELLDEAGVFMRGAKVVKDDRLAPGEKRVERFTFKMARTAPARAVARFYYRYEPDAAGRRDFGSPSLSISAWVDAQ